MEPEVFLLGVCGDLGGGSTINSGKYRAWKSHRLSSNPV